MRSSPLPADPEGERHEIREKYDASAHLYDRMEALPEWLGLRRLRRELFRKASGHVLEIAIGTGKNLAAYPVGSEIVGVDFSPGMLAIAAERAKRLGASVALRPMDAEHLDFADASFDTVTSSLSLCTFPDPLRALREMARVCQPNGRILLLEHGRSDRGWIGRWQDRRADARAEPFGCRWNREPLDLVTQAGLRVIWNRRTFLGVFHLIEARPDSSH